MIPALVALLILVGWALAIAFAVAAIRRPRHRLELAAGWVLGAAMVAMLLVGALGPPA